MGAVPFAKESCCGFVGGGGWLSYRLATLNTSFICTKPTVGHGTSLRGVTSFVWPTRGSPAERVCVTCSCACPPNRCMRFTRQPNTNAPQPAPCWPTWRRCAVRLPEPQYGVQDRVCGGLTFAANPASVELERVYVYTQGSQNCLRFVGQANKSSASQLP
jgi:hypothetical protein